MANKIFYTMDNVGNAKYVVNFHDGVKMHKDGSQFYDIEIFKNREDRDTFIRRLLEDKYTERVY